MRGVVALVVLFVALVWEASDGLWLRTYKPELRPDMIPKSRISNPPNNYAFVTLLTNDVFLPGVLVLGYSLEVVKSRYPRVCLVTDSVSPHAQKLLEDSGWVLDHVQPIKNPHWQAPNFQSRLLWVFTKLRVFSVAYEKILYVDADMVVTQNIDEAFSCGDFCAVMRDNHFNTGFMAIKPSKELFEAMFHDYATTPSYNAGEQGFTNSRYPHMSLMPLFSPTRSLDGVSRSSKFQNNDTRLSNTYNGDVALYYLRGESWRGGPPKIIHYTMLYFKPWNWYEYIIFPLNWVWHNHLPLAPESLMTTLSRFIVPNILLGITLWSDLFTFSSTSPTMKSWAQFTANFSWLYALILMFVQWLAFFAIALFCVFVVVPGIPQLHVYSASLLYVQWVVSLNFIVGIVISRIHQHLGSIVHPYRSLAGYTDVWSRFRWIVAGVFLFSSYFVMRSFTIVHNPAAIIEATAVAASALVLLCTLFYRLPIVAFRVGQSKGTQRLQDNDSL